MDLQRLEIFENPSSKNIPKVVMNKNNELVYISRALVPSSKKKVKYSFTNKFVFMRLIKKSLQNLAL